MIAELSVANFAIIDTLRIGFGPGLNILTGETGAGKSIIIDALGAVLGDRVSADLVRHGSPQATIDAVVELDGSQLRPELRMVLSELGVDLDEGTMILSREISSSGRSGARINGRAVTASALRQVGELLVDIHGQSEHLSLLRPGQALLLLDRFGGLEGERLRFAERYREWRELQRQLRDLSTRSRERVQRLDLLRYQIEEIEGAALEVGEDERLANERGRLAHAEHLLSDISAALNAIRGDDLSVDGMEAGALARLNVASSVLRGAADLDPSLEPIAERLDEQRYLLEDLSADIRTYQEQLEVDPEKLALVDDRLELIKGLKRKYGETIADILAYRDQANTELVELESQEVDEGTLTERLERLTEELRVSAARLSEARQAAAARLSPEIEEAIADLRLGSAVIAIDVRARADGQGAPDERWNLPVDETGGDIVELLFAPNAGEDLKPLSKIASGGEMARIMLAVKSILAEADATPTLVFDEVDVGVGGRSGDAVGLKLVGIADTHQVIAITHLPQVAAYADHHFVIRKAEEGGRTTSAVTEIRDQDRIDEIAAMLDGEPVTELSRTKALEMLERARGAQNVG